GPFESRLSPRQTEIRDHGTLTACIGNQHNVAALKIRVHDSDLVSGFETLRHLDDDGRGSGPGQPSRAPNARRERLAAQQFHGEKQQRRLSRTFLAVEPDVENTAHVRMRHLTGKLDLPMKATDVSFVARNLRTKCFER